MEQINVNYQFFLWFSSAAANLFIVVSYTSSLAWIRILHWSAPRDSRDLQNNSIILLLDEDIYSQNPVQHYPHSAPTKVWLL
jgi:hypothetical protein